MMSSVFVLLFIVGLATAELPPIGSVRVTIDNFSGKPVNLFWISYDKSLVPQTKQAILNGSTTYINSYNTHKFRVIPKGEEDNEKCVTFVKGPYEETVAILPSHDDSDKLRVVQVSEFDKFNTKVHEAAKSCGKSGNAGYTKCMARLLYEDIAKREKQQQLLDHFRDKISNRMRNYTCNDTSLESTLPIKHHMISIQDKSYNVSTYLELEAANIWTVRNFITDDECEHLIKHGRPRLQRATVAGEEGLHTISMSRKAQQASYNIGDHADEDPLWSLYNRIFDFTNMHTDYDLDLAGQEGFTIIQYNKDDEYQPHCDGSCDGKAYQNRGRVATAIVYCKVPEKGGATAFTKSDIFIKPEKGMATFFSYKGADGFMDPGFTEHTGCPILEGEKWISTVWMRQGVDYEHDWAGVDPSGERTAEEYYFDEANKNSGSRHFEL